MKPLDANELKRQMARLAKTADVAEAFGKTQMTIFNWRRWRGLPFLAFTEHRRPIILFDKVQVLRWAKKHDVPIDVSKLI